MMASRDLCALLILTFATSCLAGGSRSLLQAGTTCQSTGPSAWWGCCQTKNQNTTLDSTCPPSNCGSLTNQTDVTACCAFKSQQNMTDTTCTSKPGDKCSSTGPSGWWTCCQSKQQQGDTTCPPQKCGDLSGAEDIVACCSFKGAFNDATCPKPGSSCSDQGPSYWMNCCLQKNATGEADTSCPPPSCKDLQGQANIDACCAWKASTNTTDKACPAVKPGSQCSSEGPANYWACCTSKGANTTDTSCPPASCGSLTSGQADITACCATKAPGSDTSCPVPGQKCQTTGPTNWLSCCNAKAANGTAAKDGTCPPPQCALLSPQSNIDSCCATAGGYAKDSTCPCATAGSDGYWPCCQKKAQTGTADASCPPPTCGTLTPQANIDACCSAKGGYANDNTCSCSTAGTDGYWACCDARKKNGVADSACPPPKCSALTPQVNIDLCCASKGGYAQDNSCPCDTAGPAGYFQCCQDKAKAGVADAKCPPPKCGDLSPQANIDACCAAKGGFAQDTTCPCSTAVPKDYWQCCVARGKNGTGDASCPPPACGQLQGQDNIVACCIAKGGYEGGDKTCPPPCQTLGANKWWSCCTDQRFVDKIPDSTCPPKTCGDVAPQSNVDKCCSYKGIFTDDRSCPLTVCYNYTPTVATLQTIQANATANMALTANATELRAIGANGMSQMIGLVEGNSTQFNNTVVYSNYPIPRN